MLQKLATGGHGHETTEKRQVKFRFQYFQLNIKVRALMTVDPFTPENIRVVRKMKKQRKRKFKIKGRKGTEVSGEFRKRKYKRNQK